MIYYMDKGIKKLEQKPFYIRWGCNHNIIDKSTCSSIGLTRLSGDDRLVFCDKCGKIKRKYSIEY